MPRLLATLLILPVFLGLAACGDTWDGVREDTSENLESTGEALEDAGDEVDD